MSDPLDMICEITGCSREEAEAVFAETKDVVEASDRLLKKTELKSQKYIPPKSEQVLTAEQKEVKKVRELMKQMDDRRGPTSLSPPARCEEGAQPALPESTAPQSSHH
jgi:hypothetical protein